MHIVAIAWMFVVVLMSLAEATSPQGTLLGAFFTLLLYGLLPLSIVLYLLGTPMRRRARQRAEAAEASTPQSDAGGEAAGGAVAPERKEP
jgi:membrane protein implicated in regulation of membrane protease activity